MQKHLVGTLFEEEEKDKKTTLANMKAKDPMGNTRWKGAFTGGFEAGYKNTCGTRQGWTPSQFVSSVYKRQEHVEQNIFDYMDKEDLGRESIANNVSLNAEFQVTEKNSLNVSLKQSIGEKILHKLKKNEAFKNAPENINDLSQLLDKYAMQDEAETFNVAYDFKDLAMPSTVGAVSHLIPDDDFIMAYQELYTKIIRGQAKEDTEEDIQKRKEENKIHFDFTRSLEPEQDYLRQIQEVEEEGRPKKRRKNLMNQLTLKDLFQNGKRFQEFNKTDLPKVPEDFDPFAKIRSLNKSKDQAWMELKETKPMTHDVTSRSQILGEKRLSSKFVSSKLQNKFLSNEDKVNELKKFFEDEAKNQRYLDYVLELQGKSISAQLHNRSFEEVEREKSEFELLYKQRETAPKSLPIKIEAALQNRLIHDLQIERTVSSWRPEKLLCKRFGVVATSN